MDAGFEVYWNTEKCFVLASSIGLEEFITCLRSKNEAEIILQCKEGKDEIPSFPISKIVRNQCQFSREQRRRSCKCQLDWWKLLCCGGGSYYICVFMKRDNRTHHWIVRSVKSISKYFQRRLLIPTFLFDGGGKSL